MGERAWMERLPAHRLPLPSLLTIKNVVRSKLLHILARLDTKMLIGQIGKLQTHDPHFDS